MAQFEFTAGDKAHTSTLVWHTFVVVAVGPSANGGDSGGSAEDTTTVDHDCGVQRWW